MPTVYGLKLAVFPILPLGQAERVKRNHASRVISTQTKRLAKHKKTADH